MASTNKTTNLELSQYIGTDKPTYLGDYNSDMLKIDTASGTLGNAIQTVAGNLQTTNSNIGTLSSLQTTDKTSIVNAVNEVNTNTGTNSTNIGTLSNLTTTNKTTVVNAINEVNTNLKNINLTTFNTFSDSQMTASHGSVNHGSSITVATNSDGSLAKIYGSIVLYTGTGITADAYVSIQSALRPAQDITISCLGTLAVYTTGGINSVKNADITIKTTGEIRFLLPVSNDINILRSVYYPCLLFVTDFGDTPVTPD